MKTALLFSNSSTSSKRKINSQCHNSLNSILHNNNDKILSKFRDINYNKTSVMREQYKTISSLKNDYLIKNKASNCDINMNILNNPFISTKFKNKLNDFASLSPTYNIKNKYQEKDPFERKTKELLLLYTPQKSIKSFSFLDSNKEIEDITMKKPKKNKIAEMERFIERTINSSRGNFLDSFRSTQEQSKKVQDNKKQIRQTEKEELDNYCNEFSYQTQREENGQYQTKAKFLSSFFY